MFKIIPINIIHICIQIINIHIFLHLLIMIIHLHFYQYLSPNFYYPPPNYNRPPSNESRSSRVDTPSRVQVSQWLCFMKSFRGLEDLKRKKFKERQELARKDVWRSLGDLQSHWAMIRGPSCFWFKDEDIMYT